MTIYRLYQENGHRADFWVQHRSWSNSCARVISVAGLESGRLPGAPPRHGEAAVVMLMFDVRSGRPLHDVQASADGAAPATLARSVAIPGEADDAPRIGKSDVLRLDPGDRHYASIAEPFWHADRRRRGVERTKISAWNVGTGGETGET